LRQRQKAQAPPRGGLLQRLTDSGFQASASALTECISSGGTDLLFEALANLQGGSASLVRAELVGLLLVLVAHGFPQSSGREAELLMELQNTLTSLYQAAEWSCVEDSEQFREMPTRLCEGCVSFSAHGELKRSLVEAPETLQGILEFMYDADLSEPSLAFAVVAFLFNLCQGRGDLESMGGTSAMLHSGLRQDGLLGLLYSDILAAADPGPPELAAYFRATLCAPHASCQSNCPLAAALLAKCAQSCPSSHFLVGLTLRLLCLEPDHRTGMASCGGVICTLLHLSDSAGEAGWVGIYQTLAQVCITTDPALITEEDQLRAIAPLVRLMQHSDEQLQLDGAMGLTNLLTIGDSVRSMALQAGAWSLCQERLFSENEGVRRAVTEAMCNFTAAPEVVEFYASGEGDLELQGFTSFCSAADHGTQVAATGALAMLARHPEVALRIASGARCQRLLEVLSSSEDPDIQHRVVSCLNGIYQAPGVATDLRKLIRTAFVEKQNSRGFVSSEAEALAFSAMGDEGC